MPSNPTIEIGRRGVVSFKIGDTKFDVDIFLFNNEWAQIDQKHRDGTGKELPHYLDLVKKWGGPADVTGVEAIAIVNKVAELAEAEKKSIETSLISAGVTSSTAGISAPSSAG